MRGHGLGVAGVARRGEDGLAPGLPSLAHQRDHVVLVRQKFGIVLDVIGDPQTLAEASRFRGGLISTVEGSQVGGRVELTSVDQVRIDAVVTPRAPRFARPA